MKKIFFFTVICVYIFLAPLEARWGTPDEASVRKKVNQQLTMETDGSYELEITQSVTFLNEEARNNSSSFSQVYDANHQSMEIESAQMQVGDEIFDIPLGQLIEEKLASEPTDLANKVQLLLPFPNAPVGATFICKWRVKHKPVLPKCFLWMRHFYGTTLWEEGCRFKFTSALPLEYRVTNPENCIQATETTENGLQVLIFTCNKMIYQNIISEKDVHLDFFSLPSISVANKTRTDQMGDVLYASYEKALLQPLPPFIKSTIDARQAEERTADDAVFRLNAQNIIETLIEKMRYVHDGSSLENYYQPRSFQEVEKTKYGDCKEFSTLLVIALRKLGFEAQIAFVEREIPYVPIPLPPSQAMCDHVIIKAVSPSKNVHWLDATNMLAMVNDIFPDIADRPCWVLTKDGLVQEKTPLHGPAGAHQSEKWTICDAKSSTSLHVVFSASGKETVPLLESLKKLEPGPWRDLLPAMVARGGRPNAQDICVAEHSLHTSKLSFELSYRQEDFWGKTNLGPSCTLHPPAWAHTILAMNEDGIGWLPLEHTGSFDYSLFFKGKKAEGLKTFNFDISTPWLDARRTLTQASNGLQLQETAEVKTSRISAEDVQGCEFKKLVSTLKTHYKNAALVFCADEST